MQYIFSKTLDEGMLQSKPGCREGLRMLLLLHALIPCLAVYKFMHTLLQEIEPNMQRLRKLAANG